MFMSQFGFPFAYKKATQALNFFAQQAGGRLSKLRALKLVFFADRYHLRKYGRLVTNDEYWAMDYGPVASNTKDLAEMSAFLGEQEKAYAKKFLEPADQDHRYGSKAPVDESVLSASDLEALQFAWKTFGRKGRLVDLTHEYPERKRHEATLKAKQVSRVRIRYEDFVENPRPGVDPCQSLTREEQEDRREALRELEVFEVKWS
jgi:uncharacterized phage-associated protein